MMNYLLANISQKLAKRTSEMLDQKALWDLGYLMDSPISKPNNIIILDWQV